MPGLVVTLTGNSAGYEAMLKESVVQAKVAAAAIHEVMIKDIGRLQSKYNALDPNSANAIALFQVIQQKKSDLVKLHSGADAQESFALLQMNKASTAAKIAMDKQELMSETAKLAAEENAAAAYYANRVKMSAKTRVAIQADDRILAASQALWAGYAPGIQTSKADLKPLRDELAQAIKARRAPSQAAAAAASLAVIESRVAAAAAGKASGMGHGPGGLTGIIRESLVIMREISMGRGMGRIGGSVTLLAQYLGVLKFAVKSTATESLLAAKAARELSVAMDIQALRAKGTAAYTELETAAKAQNVVATDAEKVANYELLTAKVALNAVFFAGIGLFLAAGAAAFFVWRHFKNLAAAAKSLADMTDLTTTSFSEQEKVLDEGVKAHQESIDWEKKHAESQAGLKDAYDETIKSMRAQFEYEKELAAARGASKAQLARMEIEEERKELAVLEAARDAAEQKHHEDFLAQQDHQKRLDNFNSGTGFFSAQTLAAALKKSDENKAIVAANEKAMKESHWMEAAQALKEQSGGNHVISLAEDLMHSFGSRKGETVDEYIAGLEKAKYEFTVGGKTYNQSVSTSRDAYGQVQTDVIQLTQLETELKDMVASGKELMGKDLDEYNKKKSEAAELAAKLGIDEKYSEKLAALQGGGGHFEVTERERIGLGAASSVQVSILDYTKRIAVHGENSAQTLQRIEQFMAENNGSF